MTRIDSQGIIADSIKTSTGEKYITEAEVNIENITSSAIDKATENAINAQTLAETAALEALESERNAQNAQSLAEIAAANALVSETNVIKTSEKVLEQLSEILSADGEIRITSAHSLGDFYFSITSHMPEGVLPLNGSEVSRTTYSDLYDYVLNIHNELVASNNKFIVSEEEWQNISIENNGYVPYYSYGTLDGMFRLPRMSGYLKATGEVDEAGNYIAEGLPNITGTFAQGGMNTYYDGAFSNYNSFSGVGANSQLNFAASFDASRSNPIYGNSEHVTPETNTLFVGVWALTAFTQVGTANLNEIKEILSQCETILGDSLPLLSSRYDNKGLETSAWKLSDGSWLDGRIYTEAYNKLIEKIAESNSQYLEMKESELLSPIEFPESYLVDTENVKFRLPLMVVNERTIIKQWQEGTEWYTIYSDGWIEQGGEGYHNVKEVHTVNLLVPYKNTDYYVTKSIGVDGIYTNEASICYVSIFNYTTTTFNTRSGASSGLTRFRWKACGYGEIPPREEWEIDFNYYFKVSHGVDEGRINIEEKLSEFEETAYTRLDEVVEEVSKDYVVHVDKQVGELYFSFDNYCPDGVIPLDGRLVSRATYADLWQWVQEKGLVKDDALITTNDVNTVSIFNEDGTIRYCQWYGSGDGSLTFRMPKINGYLGATGDNTLAGQYVAEGLPNIEGQARIATKSGFLQSTAVTTGAFWSESNDGKAPGVNDNVAGRSLNFDASLSNPIYGNSEHVTPETNTLFVGVWAITASKAAVFDMRDVEEALKSAESYLMNNVPLMSSRWDRDGLGNLGWVKADGSWVDGKTYTGAYNYCVEKLVSGHEDFVDGQVAAISEENFDKFIVDRINKRFRLPITNGQKTWEDVQGLNNPNWVLYFKLAHEFYIPAQAELQEKLDLIDNLVVKTDINLPTLSSRWDSDFAENIGWVKSEGQWLNGNVYRDAYDLMVSRIGINTKFIASTVGTELTDENADKFLIDTAAVKFRLPLINGERILVASNKTGAEWYNYYSDGWLEQGGEVDKDTGSITYPKQFIDTKYFIDRCSIGLGGDANAYNNYAGTGKSKTDTRTTEGVTFNTGTHTLGYIWQAKGKGPILNVSEYNRGMYLFFKLADEVPSTVVDTQQIINDLKQECDDFKADLEEKYNSGIYVLEADFITIEDESGNPTGQYSWYRKWSDGWVEQGGNFIWDGSTTNPKTYIVTLLEPLRDINYQVFTSMENYTATGYYPWVNNKTTTSFELYVSGTSATKSNVAWKASGYKS